MTFTRYMLQRIAATIILFALISCACFLMLDFAPGSFFDEMRIDPRISPATVAALRSAHGLSQPALVRYLAWTKSALRGDLGISFASNQPVSKLLLPRLGNTLLLTVPSLLLAWMVGLVTGAWCAVKPASWLDHVANFCATVLHTIPELVLCCIALLVAARTRLLPAGGMLSPLSSAPSASAHLWDLCRHMLLPVLVLTTMAVPTIFWHTRAAVLDVSSQPFIRSARGHGLSPKTLLWRHVLPVAANALISLGGISLGTLLSASLVIEVLFGWPGVGPLFLDAITARDPYLIIAAVLCSAAFLTTGNLLADLTLHYRDPRLRFAS